MLCDICHKNISTVHLTEIINDKVVEMHICQSCAKHKTEELKEQLSVSDFLGSLMDIGEASREETSFKCPLCGLKYKEFKKKGRLGCEKCYVTFKDMLFPLLKNIHSSTTHLGKTPLDVQIIREKSVEVKIKELKERLEKVIQKEEYEEAAALRDKIRKLEKSGKTDSNDNV